MGFTTIKRAKDMIGYYKEHCKIVAEHEAAEKEARKKGKKFKTKYIEVD